MTIHELELENNFKNLKFLKILTFKIIILVLYPIYLLICLLTPYYFTSKDNLMAYSECDRGLSWKSYYVYIAFAVITFIIELSIYIKAIR